MSNRLLKLAVIYLVLGMSLGVYMGLSHQFQFHSLHAHINLLGWVSLALAAFAFRLYPAMAETRLAALFFWIYNLALPVGLAGLALMAAGYSWAEPVLGIGFTLVWAAGVLFAINVLWNLRAPRASAPYTGAVRNPAFGA